MKKLGLFGLSVVMLCAGCGHGWLPFRRGAACNDHCVNYGPSYSHNCDGCVGYPEYASEGIVGEPYYGPSTTIPSNPPMTNPPMSNLGPRT